MFEITFNPSSGCWDVFLNAAGERLAIAFGFHSQEGAEEIVKRLTHA